MKVIIEIDCDNAAFSLEEGGPVAEVAYILGELSDRIQDDPLDLPDREIALRDSNGNTVGRFRVEDRT